ncbi:MAG TPA: acetyl-CoA hydrolase/transferase C-terminal domain-containing protein [Spirochaetota bacterium]|nr:acetyl-CoA hydrolase/transferase C-terminal domain-containing protein [Spirochaetota bacterium]HPF07351.1 acetyl-CoA hydrolase/transferase C-terminal domain-containing protein [Spirochaetota bacterium]HPJ43737.1 acetyl-CoA hydrolase/transferase C-terminal domain-containing protein [Spirochaetota bacterium]HPR38766.1 acetyl-CoA hydrolase/transferase C-terminal domain-containing protein [Spirochaetota bacterium]HRX48859.1 acetyl-CoA hydrolase/transferase C-terminal domain-containing protein [S
MNLMITNYENEYRDKLISGEQAAAMVKSDSTVSYGGFILSPVYIDKFIAQRVNELNNVKIQTQVYPGLCQAAWADQKREHIYFTNCHFSPGDRILHDMGLCDFVPTLFHEHPWVLQNGHVQSDILFFRAGAMDKNGFFNFGIANTFLKEFSNQSKIVVLEINKNLPHCNGGLNEAIHISEVDYIVESDHAPLMAAPAVETTETDKKIADILLKEMKDGSCIQLGIGGMPNALGKMLATSGLKDLGVHTEMLVDSYVDMFEQGCITNMKKQVYTGKMAYTFAFGSQRLYDFMDHNPFLASYPVNLINDPKIISMNDNVVSINNCLEVDLMSQVSSESNGHRHITGTGGQWDFVYGAFHSKGGKSFLCLESTHTDKNGNMKSRIVPYFKPGTAVSVTRNMVHYIVTENGIACMKAKSTWERAEALISIAHPSFREELIAEAEKMNIWRKSNKQD